MGAFRAMLVFVAQQLAAADRPAQPHLAQAWQAMSSGDGLPDQAGLESYLYEDCPKGATSEDCLHAHVWNYGANNCIKIEVDGGFKYPYAKGSDTYYVKCDSVDCCHKGERPDVKKWDIDSPGLLEKALIQVAYLGKNDTTELNDTPVKGAEVWKETVKLPFTKGMAVTYTYFVTRNNTDIITHRIDYDAGAAAAPGSILYGGFKVVHEQDLAEHRKLFIPPDQCKGNIIQCDDEMMKEWDRKYFKHSTAFQKVTRAAEAAPEVSCIGPRYECDDKHRKCCLGLRCKPGADPTNTTTTCHILEDVIV